MQINKPCPCCGTIQKVDIRHEWNTDPAKRPELTLLLNPQSTKHDLPKLEHLVPLSDDGQELVVTAERIGPQDVMLHIIRQPKNGEAPVKREPAKTLHTRADMLTEAGELGVKVNEKWTDVQLAQAITNRKKQMGPAVTDSV